ncbi:HAD family hydrolase [Xanthomonas maliensis]|uniref:HAD family hydrolase n=1 Tax=Xanthomonas maliensis TaxID=1321368 RepID=UPI00039D0C41|nr:HAD family hydrolase [Xanthomonas maliensis]KAB7762880.1 hydrolase [Xanthomonas maliensis]
MHAPPGLIIFDCDGVLVDSEPLACSVLAQTLRRHDLDMDAAAVKQRFLGRSLASVRAHAQTLGIALPDTFEPDLNTELLARLRSDLRPVPGVAALLEVLDRPLCVASSSHLERVRLCLQVTGLARYFGQHVYTAERVAHGKPAPDLFLFAADGMQVAPGNCLVIEDSPSGLQAARAAGMQGWGFTGGSHHGATADAAAALTTAGAVRVFDSMAAVSAALDAAGCVRPGTALG